MESRVESNDVLYGRYLFGPLPRGLGATIATALRRSLLSELSGLAITSVEIVGVEHEYSVIPGARETVIDLTLNLKKLVFTSTDPRRKRGIGYISVRGPGEITGHDLRLPPGLQCVNPDEILATVAANGYVNLKVGISAGKNYVVHSRGSLKTYDKPNVTRRKTATRKSFLVDAVFMPVRRVNFLIHSDEDVLRFPLHIPSRDVSERVIFEIWTNGTITPREAMDQAARQLILTFSLFRISRNPKIFAERPIHTYLIDDETQKELPHTLQAAYGENQFLKTDIGILPMTPAALRAFKSRNIHLLGDLLNYSYDALLEVSGMTPESLFQMLCYLRAFGVQFKTKQKKLVLPKEPKRSKFRRPKFSRPGSFGFRP